MKKIATIITIFILTVLITTVLIINIAKTELSNNTQLDTNINESEFSEHLEKDETDYVTEITEIIDESFIENEKNEEIESKSINISDDKMDIEENKLENKLNQVKDDEEIKEKIENDKQTTKIEEPKKEEKINKSNIEKQLGEIQKEETKIEESKKEEEIDEDIFSKELDEIKKEETKIEISKKEEFDNNEKTKEIPIWEDLGITEYEFYNTPMWKWARVDFSVEVYGNELATRAACIAKGESLESGKAYSCSTINSYSGDYLGEMLQIFEAQ